MSKIQTQIKKFKQLYQKLIKKEDIEYAIKQTMIILKPPTKPKAVKSPYIIYKQENITRIQKEMKEMYNGQSTTFIHKKVLSGLKSEWKQIDDIVKQEYIDLSDKDKNRYQYEMKQYYIDDPYQCAIDNKKNIVKAIAVTNKQDMKKQEKEVLKIVKSRYDITRYKTAYQLWHLDNYQAAKTNVIGKKTRYEINRMLKGKWERTVRDEEKKQYIDQENADKQRYLNKMTTYSNIVRKELNYPNVLYTKVVVKKKECEHLPIPPSLQLPHDDVGLDAAVKSAIQSVETFTSSALADEKSEIMPTEKKVILDITSGIVGVDNIRRQSEGYLDILENINLRSIKKKKFRCRVKILQTIIFTHRRDIRFSDKLGDVTPIDEIDTIANNHDVTVAAIWEDTQKIMSFYEMLPSSCWNYKKSKEYEKICHVEIAIGKRLKALVWQTYDNKNDWVAILSKYYDTFFGKGSEWTHILKSHQVWNDLIGQRHVRFYPHGLWLILNIDPVAMTACYKYYQPCVTDDDFKVISDRLLEKMGSEVVTVPNQLLKNIPLNIFSITDVENIWDKILCVNNYRIVKNTR